MKITEALERAARHPVHLATDRTEEHYRAIRERDLVPPTTKVTTMLVAALTCLALAALLVSGKLVDIAERQPLGERRNLWVVGASNLDRASNYLSLNRPYDFILKIRGAGTGAGQQIDSIEAVAVAVGIELGREPSSGITPRTGESTGGGAAGPSQQVVTPAPVPGPVAVEPGVRVEAPSTVPVRDPTTTDPGSPTTVNVGPSSPKPVLKPPPLGRTVTPQMPLRVYVAGDSQATFLGQTLTTRAGDLFDITKADRISTSLARPDYFNWPAEVIDVVATDDPEFVVFFLGSNDWQDMRSGDDRRLVRGTEEWRKEWSWRLFITFELLVAEHRHVVWVSQPPMRDGTFNEGGMVMNEIAREVIANRDDVTMIDIWEMFGGDGEYRERVIGPDGTEARARADDGVHLRRRAAGWVADLVIDTASRQWDLRYD